MHELLIKKIKEKKPLDRLDDFYINEKVEEFLKINSSIRKKMDFTNEKNKEFRIALKGVRGELNKRYGIFWSDGLKLESHKSSKERLGFYKELYKKIFSITGKVDSILDISAGLNPLSYKYIGFKGRYIATELAKKDVDLLNEYFIKNRINGSAIQLDLRKDFVFPAVDAVFLFKVFDSVEEKGHKLAERVLTSLTCRYAIVSFSTVGVKGKRMNFPNRGWIERLLKRLNLGYKKLGFGNEVFYVVKL